MIVRHSRGAYEISFEKLVTALSRLDGQCRVISDSNVWPLYGSSIASIPHLVILAGEQSKAPRIIEQVWNWLAESSADRHTRIVALGGGVVGDLAGFAAASYMRGVSWGFIPTTLLAQIDSSIGGKTGINLLAGKNLIGAFHAPDWVSICVETLTSLPHREFLAGSSELWKHAAIADADLFDELEKTLPSSPDAELERLIERSLRIKAAIIEEDEFESEGIREQLNFGHTVGHALEKLFGYGTKLHGEAVAIGMVVEARIGECLNVTPRGVADRIEHALSKAGLPTSMQGIEPQTLVGAMRADKKAQSGNVSMALLTDLGRCKLIRDLPEDSLLKCLAFCR